MPHLDHGWRNVNNWIPTCVHEFHGNLFYNTGPKPSQKHRTPCNLSNHEMLGPWRKSGSSPWLVWQMKRWSEISIILNGTCMQIKQYYTVYTLVFTEFLHHTFNHWYTNWIDHGEPSYRSPEDGSSHPLPGQGAISLQTMMPIHDLKIRLKKETKCGPLLPFLMGTFPTHRRTASSCPCEDPKGCACMMWCWETSDLNLNWKKQPTRMRM